MKLLNDNILVKVKKKADEIKTASGIVLANVEQDLYTGIVVGIPERKEYLVVSRQADGTPNRNPDGSKKEVWRAIEVKVGDTVLFERKVHHEYDMRDRVKIDHFVPMPEMTDSAYDYFITKNDDIYGVIPTSEAIGDGNLLGELYPDAPPKKVTKSIGY